jgi:UDP-GlcNAc3NAcA epimerase
LKKKIVTVIGARPQIIKSAALSRSIAKSFAMEIEEVIVHTGQHYDENMSEIFFNELEIPIPKHNLGVGSGSHGAMTAKMIEGLEKIFLVENPNAVVIYGDTNSTLAAAIAASKIHIPIIHIEAGLRSYNKSMPEEINRITADHMSTLLFSPTITGIKNLLKEGFVENIASKASIDNPKFFHCGDVMFDNSLYFSDKSEQVSNIVKDLKLTGEDFILCTFHRDSNTDNKTNLTAIFESIIEISHSKNISIVLPIHPRTKHKMNMLLDENLLEEIKRNSKIKLLPPAGFLDIISLEKKSKLVITDSGGLQKEAYFFKKPCLILREQTEWIEIVENGNALIVGANKQLILDGVDELLDKKNLSYPNFYGDGRAAEFILQKILSEI